jgi:deoxyribodipyrimidine photo-lyase
LEITIFWFRRDLRLEDNIAFYNALNSGIPVLPIFIFDKSIVDELAKDDARVNFIYQRLTLVNKQLNTHNSSLKLFKSSVDNVWEELVKEYVIKQVYFNEDYEPYAKERDERVVKYLKTKGIETHSYTDHIVFKPD